MKHRIRFSFALALLLSVAALAQDAARTHPELAAAHGFSKKAVSLLGTVSDDGKFFLADPDAEVWTVSNPELLKSQQGQRVALKVQVDRTSGEIRVLCVTPGERQTNAMANLGDSAFRR